MSRERPTKRAAVRRLGALLVVLMAGCELPGQPDPADRPVPADQVVNFEALYRRHCSGCHGADGRLGPAPPLNDPIFLAIVPDAELFHVVAEGRPGTPMPAFSLEGGGPLTATQMMALVNGIKPRWGRRPQASGPVPPYAVTADGDEGAGPGDGRRGADVFDRACASCHGSLGEGGTDGDRPVGALNDPAFLALISDQALRRYAITGRPDMGMPDYAGKAGRSDDYQPLTSREITDLVAFLGSWRHEDRPAPVDTASRGPGTSRPEDRGRMATAGEVKGE